MTSTVTAKHHFQTESFFTSSVIASRCDSNPRMAPCEPGHRGWGHVSPGSLRTFYTEFAQDCFHCFLNVGNERNDSILTVLFANMKSEFQQCQFILK